MLAYLAYKAGIRHYTHGLYFFLQKTYPTVLSAMCLTLPYAPSTSSSLLCCLGDALIRSPLAESTWEFGDHRRLRL